MAKADIAAALLLKGSAVTAAPVNPTRLAEELGLLVITHAGPADLSGMLMRRDGQQVIGVNGEHPPTRQRFSVAHMLGHFQLHRRRPLILCTDRRAALGDAFSSLATDREEAEANRFAGALLAPEPLIREAVKRIQFQTAEEMTRALGGRLGLSFPAMACRLMSLGVILDL